MSKSQTSKSEITKATFLPIPMYRQCFTLLSSLLMEAFHVNTLYHTAPYQDFTQIDQGIRAAVWTNYEDESSRGYFSETDKADRILVVKSNLGFYNLILTIQETPGADFISVGPFRDEELTPEYFASILKEAKIPPATIQRIRNIYENMPFAHLDAVLGVTKQVLAVWYEDFATLVPQLLQYAEQKRAVALDYDILDKKNAEDSRQYQTQLFSFLNHIKQGDAEQAKATLRTFWHTAHFDKAKNTKDYRAHLMRLNEYCHLALLETDIHPSHILKQADSLRMKLDTTTSFAKLEQMSAEICRKYCLLVKNYANPGYSKLTRDIIAHIRSSMEEPLSLAYFADYFDKNASLLSHTFKKETGMTLTDYIRRVRMEEALRLLHTTDLSISEIAVAVGYTDFSYFSKIFSHFHGQSPSAYRRGAEST